MKEKHGMRWTTLRGKQKVQMQAMLLFAAMNLKKLATWQWRKTRHCLLFRFFMVKALLNGFFRSAFSTVCKLLRELFYLFKISGVMYRFYQYITPVFLLEAPQIFRNFIPQRIIGFLIVFNLIIQKSLYIFLP
jgi:Transposase DDE domain